MRAPTWDVLVGDVLDGLRSLPDESVHCVVTSPPYWGLRDYGAEGMIGLEPTLGEHMAKMVEVFGEVRRVLRSDGTLWLNYGDAYSGGGSGDTKSGFNARYFGTDIAPGKQAGHGKARRKGAKETEANKARAKAKGYDVGAWGASDGAAEGFDRCAVDSGLAAKQRMLLPARVALALQDSGWWVRSEIVWAKGVSFCPTYSGSCMPSSVRDRPTDSHEMLYLLAKGGEWVSRVVALSDFKAERFHGRDNFRPESPRSGSDALSVRLATAILDSAKAEDDFSLPALYAEVRQDCSNGGNRLKVSGLPVTHRAPALAASLLCAEASPEEFMCELHCLGVSLADRYNLLIGGGKPFLLPPGVFPDGDGAVGVDYSGEVCKFDFLHGQIVTSRPPTKCSYFYDADAVREVPVMRPQRRGSRPGRPDAGRPPGQPRDAGLESLTRSEPGVDANPAGRNLRTVWTINPRGYREAHFATFPEALVEPCVKAGTSEHGCCAECGAPWRRIVQAKGGSIGQSWHDHADDLGSGNVKNDLGGTAEYKTYSRQTLGWEPTCEHAEAERVPCTVLDPFNGSGTTGAVAIRLGRSYVGIELNPDYAEMSRKRIGRAAAEAGQGGDVSVSEDPVRAQFGLFGETA